MQMKVLIQTRIKKTVSKQWDSFKRIVCKNFKIYSPCMSASTQWTTKHLHINTLIIQKYVIELFKTQDLKYSLKGHHKLIIRKSYFVRVVRASGYARAFQ